MKTTSEKELLKWLNRENHTVLENLNFGIKAIRSVDFVLSSKYNTVLEWISSKSSEILTESVSEKEEFGTLTKLLELKYPISLITHAACSQFLDKVLCFAQNPKKKFKTRKFVEILFSISKHEIFQNIDENRYEKFCLLQKCILHRYEQYLIINKENFAFLHEREFFNKIILNIKEYIKGIPQGSIDKFGAQFMTVTLKKLIELMISVKEKLPCFDDIVEIEKVLFTKYEKRILKFSSHLPIHAHFVNMECALINFRGHNIFYKKFIKSSFDFAQRFTNSKLKLQIIIVVLKLLRKHEVNLKFEMPPEGPVKYMENQIQNIVKVYVNQNIKEVMWLLTCTIELNPLILEYSIFELAAKIITSPKTNLQEQQMYDYFMKILFEMFRKLNRPEKYVANLLKALEEHLKQNHILKQKRKNLESEESPRKKPKLNLSDFASDDEFYFNIIIKSLEVTYQNSTEIYMNHHESFKEIAFAWNTITGREFAKFISSLVSKPSLIIWKTALYNLENVIKNISDHCFKSEPNETILFSLDFSSALLSQYFTGSKIIEHYDIYSFEIENNIKLTKKILKNFGNFLLNIEHNNRIVNSFLQIVKTFGMFFFITYYYPSQNENKEINLTKTGYDFLSNDEWILIEQRIANFGDSNAKHNSNILLLQKLKGKILLQNNITSKFNIKSILPSNFQDPNQIIKLFIDENNIWMTRYMSESEKNLICNIIFQDDFENDVIYEFSKILMQNYDCFKIIITTCYEKLGKIIESKKSVLHSIDFNKYKSLPLADKVKLICQKIQNNQKGTIKNVEISKIQRNLNILNLFNVASCKEDFKTEIFILHFALYRDLLNISNNQLIENAYNILERLLHFKPFIKICDLIPFENFMEVLPTSASTKFYDLLFQNLRENKIEDIQKYLSNVPTYLKEKENSPNNQNELLFNLIKIISKIDNKKFKIILKELLREFENVFFSSAKEFESFNNEENNFIDKTFEIYPIYLNYAILRNKNNEFEITDDFRKFCKIYLGYSVKYSNEYSVRLTTIALNNRELLHFDPDEVQLILQKYWQHIKLELRTNELNHCNLEENIYKEKHYSEIIKLIVDNSSKSDFRNFLYEIENETTKDNTGYICRIIQQLSKLQLDKIKCAILNEYFKKISLEIILKLEKDLNDQFLNYNVVIMLLNTMSSLSTNREILLSLDHIDNILSFLIDINIKKFVLTDNNENLFKELHNEMTNLCIILIKSRHEIITDRMPQFIIIYQDLLQSLCWYKSDRHKDILLNKEDIQSLSEMGAKLQNIMHLLAKHELNLKRLAPYILTFIIGLMVTDKRTTTLYTEIKTHIESICYILIKICDHRVGPFILRCTNDATRHVYENLVKDFEKYHKFKGKV
ncbi:uncharacterized protein LOC129608632 [Condylostylus longicornis]|uniref:uncharacterized protein LOC129608632 n=1 Tax=Condylostylus longicornis TaxID=2530218 RepID=UPI00244DF159|nr:uncharacterized protein LOC129608632 [Condylostylus longicornis]